jgi:hypothetical protein
LPADNPTINLELGQRYEVTVLNEEDHPFQVIAKGATVNDDVVLLSSRVGFPGLFDADPEVAWVDNGLGVTTFTLTVALANALIQGPLDPGYRSGISVSTIRGDFAIAGEIPTLTPTNTPTLTATPTPTETPEENGATETPTVPSANLDGVNGVNSIDLLIFIRQWKDSRALP